MKQLQVPVVLRQVNPVGQLFGLVAEGLFTEDDFDENGKLKEGIPVQNFSDASNLRPGDIKYRDMNGDGEITAVDRTAIGGTRIPRMLFMVSEHQSDTNHLIQVYSFKELVKPTNYLEVKLGCRVVNWCRKYIFEYR